ncbi:MAG TPA: T9SS type A sorting domain-containing protein, partial [Chitinophagaceae bacterium]
NGVASITPAMIDGGSNDNCSPLTLSASRLNFSCADIGNQTVTLTVTDVSGNSSSCDATVTVKGEIPTCRITSVPSSNVYTGGVSTNLYLGYGAQQTTLQLDVPASGAPYTFLWSGNGVANLSSTAAQSPVFAPVAAGSYTFTVFITNRYGCTTTCTISICVTDIRVPGRSGTWDGKKVYVCHVPPGNPGNTQTLEISVNAVPAHIGPSGHATDRLGRCDQTPCGGVISKPPVATPVKTSAAELVVKLSPNPTSSQFALQVMSPDQRTPVLVRVMNALGKLVDVQQTTIGEVLRFGSNYVSGTYFIEVVQGDQKKVVQGVKAN